MSKIWNKFWKFLLEDILTQIFREFGILGVLSYIGGMFLLYYFPKQNEIDRQVLYALSGLALLILATFISHFRVRAQIERDKSLIEMAQNSCNRLAEQVGKSMPSDQVEAIIQKIRQIHRDSVNQILNHPIEK